MTSKEIDKIVATAVRGVLKGLEKPGSRVRPDFLKWITDRYLGFFPNDGVIIAMKIRDELKTHNIHI